VDLLGTLFRSPRAGGIRCDGNQRGVCLTSYFPPAKFRWEEVASFTME
jgi:hypothetical protein